MVPRHSRQAHGSATVPHQRHTGAAPAPVWHQGAFARGAAGRGAAALARQRRAVAAPRDLHQHRAVGAPDLIEHLPREADRGGAVDAAVGERRPGATRSRRVGRSATISPHQPDSTSDWPSAVRAYPPISRPLPSRAARSSMTSRVCGIGGPRLLEQVVAVVPQRERGRGRRTGAYAAARVPSTTAHRARARPRGTSASGRPAPGRRSGRRIRPRRAPSAKTARQRSTSRASGTHTIAPRPDASVASTASATASAGSVPGRAFHHGRGLLAGTQRGDHLGSAGGGLPDASSLDRAAIVGRLPGRDFSARAWRGGMARRRTSPERAGVAVGDVAGEAPGLRRSSTGSGETTLARKARRPACSDCLDPFDQEAVDQLAGEAHLDPAPDHGLLVEIGRHEVVEVAIQVGQAGVDRDPRDRQLAAGSGAALAGLARRGAGAGISSSCSSLPSSLTSLFYQPAVTQRRGR